MIYLPSRVLARLYELALTCLSLLTAFEAALSGVVVVLDRSKRRGQPREDFPREERPELELGQDGARLELYTEYGGSTRPCSPR